MLKNGELDALIIADSGIDTLSGTNPLKLKLDEHIADIQVVANYVNNGGRVSPPVIGDNELSWSSAPKLNGIFLYSYLSQNNLSVELIHNFAAEKTRIQSLISYRPKAIIISTPFIFFKQTLRQLADEIRAILPDVYIVAGGAFINYSFLLREKIQEDGYETKAAENDFLFLTVDNEPKIDLYIASPRGEETLVKVLHSLKESAQPDLLENTARLSGNSYVFGPRVDDISGRHAHAIDWDRLPDSVFASGVIPLQASNGCPYNCSFCNFTKDRRLTYVKPLELLIRELKMIQERGVKYVWFVDDNFRLGSDDLNQVCQRFLDEGITVKWMCFIRASTLKHADLDLLKKAGCIEVQIGLESGDSQILKNMNKKADPEMYRNVVQQLLQVGINISCYFITGFPGETAETAARTREFIRSIEDPEAPGALSWSIYPFLLSPLSPIYEPESREKYDLHGYMNSWTHKTMDYQGAKELVGKAFFELENSGPIYRGDNLELLMGLSARQRKQFYAARHKLSKKMYNNSIDPDEVINAFQVYFR